MDEWDEEESPESRASTGPQSSNQSDTTNTPATDPYIEQSSSSATPYDSTQRDMGGFADHGPLVQYGFGYNPGPPQQNFFQGQPAAGPGSIVQLYSHNLPNQGHYQPSSTGTWVAYSNYQAQIQNDAWNSTPFPNQQSLSFFPPNVVQTYPNPVPNQGSLNFYPSNTVQTYPTSVSIQTLRSWYQPQISANGNQVNSAISHPPQTLTGAMLNAPAISESPFATIRDAHSLVLAEDIEGPTFQKLIRFLIENDKPWDCWNRSIDYDGNSAWICDWPFCRLFTQYKRKSAAIRHVREDHLEWCKVMTDAEIIEKRERINGYFRKRHIRLVRAFEGSNGNINGVMATLKTGKPADKVVTMYESNEVLENDEADGGDADNEDADEDEDNNGKADDDEANNEVLENDEADDDEEMA